MKRRKFILRLSDAAVGWPLAAQGQSIRKVWRLAWLAEGWATSGSTDSTGGPFHLLS